MDAPYSRRAYGSAAGGYSLHADDMLEPKDDENLDRYAQVFERRLSLMSSTCDYLEETTVEHQQQAPENGEEADFEENHNNNKVDEEEYGDSSIESSKKLVDEVIESLMSQKHHHSSPQENPLNGGRRTSPPLLLNDDVAALEKSNDDGLSSAKIHGGNGMDSEKQQSVQDKFAAEEIKRSEKLAEMAVNESVYQIPYRSKLTEPFEPGQTLIVKGKTAEDSVRFTINLHSNTADFSGNDVPLHISVRFDEGKFVFNTFSKGEWGKEERKSNPYKKGDDIDIRIRAHDSKYTIFADQKEIKEFEHRVPLNNVTHFSIDGDVFVTHIHWGGKYYPVPYESGIAGDGFAPGKTLLLFGTPEKKGKRFHINLLKKNGDIAFHFNPRFDEKAIVRNSLIANEWGNEEREGKIPLEKGIGFDLKVVNEEYGFQVFINDDRFCAYAHRLEPHDIHGIQIGGDVEITGIQLF